jgi:HAD superfamily hydrolase (TIGR01509 family)
MAVQVKAILWDMDGVLVNTQEEHYQSIAYGLKKYGIDLQPENFQNIFGKNNRGVLTTVLGRTPSDEMVADINQVQIEWFESHIHGDSVLWPGAVQWLHQFKEWGLLQAIASSSPLGLIHTVVRECGITPCFDAIVSAETMPSKPNPMVFLQAAQKLQVDPQECLVVEDSVPGLRAAKNAGMKCLTVETTNPASLLQEADLIVPRLNQLQPAIIRKLLELDSL